MQDGVFKGVPRKPKNYHKNIELIAYCLIPNHFHLLIKQTDKNSMEGFMRSLLTKYSMYFNKRYDRVGSLFQGRYKAALVNQDKYLLHLSKYIHINPEEVSNNIVNAYSSYADFLKMRKTPWVKPDIILNFFDSELIPEIKKFNSYQRFVEDNDANSAQVLDKLILE